jgi:mannose/fructose-specific phosphotransferase system component IIA
MVRTVEVIVGSQRSFMAVGLEPADGLADIQAKIEQAVQRAEGDGGALVLTDMLGGSPSIASMPLVQKYRVEIVAGMNLPMALEALLHREEETLPKLAELVVRKSRKGIIRMTAIGRKS